jgi:hypothetical protein
MKGTVTMKILTVLPIATLFFLLTGCDGDGDGTTTTETTTEETKTVEETKAPVIIDSGSDTVDPGIYQVVSDFEIFETGMIEGTFEWTSGPSKLSPALIHYSSVEVFHADLESPATVAMEATQPLLDNSNGWRMLVYNADAQDSAIVNFTVRFTPD